MAAVSYEFLQARLQQELLGVVKSVNNVSPDAYKNITLVAEDVPYDNELSQASPDMLGLDAINVQDAIDEIDRLLKYNAVYVFDATVQSAPPNLPRGSYRQHWLSHKYGAYIGCRRAACNPRRLYTGGNIKRALFVDTYNNRLGW